MPERLRVPEPEKAPFPYSAIIILPYTSRIQGIYRRGKVISDPHYLQEARIRLSSYSALVTAAAGLLYQGGAAETIIALGENTFEDQHPSTADLMKKQLIKKSISENAIIALGNLQDTNEQLAALKKQDPKLLENPLFIIMDFHKKRVKVILAENTLSGTIISAEDILFMDFFQKKYADLKEKDPVKYNKILRHHRKQLRQFVPLKIRLAESVFGLATKLGPLSDVILKGLRTARGGPTVTDFHALASGKKQLEIAKGQIKKGKLIPVADKEKGITSDEI